MKDQIGERVKKIREDMGMTKEQFGKMIGISGQYLGTVERGINGLTVEKIKKLCEETGISANYILWGDSETVEQDKTTTMLSEFSHDQIQIAFDVIKKIALFLKTENANEMLIQNIFGSLYRQ